MNGYFIFIFLFIPKIESSAYLKIILHKVNDFIYAIYYKGIKYYDNNKKSYCTSSSNVNDYPKPLIETIYEFGNKINIIIHDLQGKGSSFIKLDVKINEYIIECSHNKFWKCSNCISNDSNYIYNNSQEYFDFYEPFTHDEENNYSLFFQINSSDELDYKGNNVSSDFYSLYADEKNINISINDIDNEINLINFNNPNYFNIKNNTHNISVNYEKYYFKIYFEKNIFNGKYKGLDLISSQDIELNNGSNFKIDESKVLRYKLSKKEKREKCATVICLSIHFPKNLNKLR